MVKKRIARPAGRILIAALLLFVSRPGLAAEGLRLSASRSVLIPLGPSPSESDYPPSAFEESFGAEAVLSYPVAPRLESLLALRYDSLELAGSPPDDEMSRFSAALGLSARIPVFAKTEALAYLEGGLYRVSLNDQDCGPLLMLAAGVGAAREITEGIALIAKAEYSHCFIEDLQPLLYAIQIEAGLEFAF